MNPIPGVARLAPVLIIPLALGDPALAQQRDPSPDSPDARISSLVQRSLRSPVSLSGPGQNQSPARGGEGAAHFPDEFRRIDGWFNNLDTPSRGGAITPFGRLAPSDYADGVSSPAGDGRPSPRLVSNLVAAQSADLPNPLRASDYVWQWGQFLDHDIDETPVAAPAEHFDIAVPEGDAWFDPSSSGSVLIPLDRSAYTMIEGVRQQMNNITAYVDASQVYGSDDARALELRTLDGTGRLKTSPGDLLPFNVNAFPNAPTPADPTLFLAGDVRANEQVGLTAMHTLFMREHNHWADLIAAQNPSLTGDEIYERARAMVAAEIQSITYREFLPVILGPDALPEYAAYDPGLDAGIANVFATAAYRFGHSMLSPQLLRLDADGDPIPAGNLPLESAFFSPQQIIDNGIDPLLRGLASQVAQNVDNSIVDGVRNFLFGAPGSGGFDLASLNIQRGRDHGLPSYNDVRVAYGRAPAADFADINPDAGVTARLASAYASVDDVDSWVGLLAEPRRDQGLVGETMSRVLSDQFTRLRDGDRFWYAAYLPSDVRDMVEEQTLAVIIRRNTSIGDEIPDNVFFVPAACAVDLAPPQGQLDFTDVIAFLEAFASQAPTADFALPFGQFDFSDIVAFLTAFGAGCP
ncbi:MAG: peroxidase family protein [Phycisphaerales bacterium]